MFCEFAEEGDAVLPRAALLLCNVQRSVTVTVAGSSERAPFEILYQRIGQLLHGVLRGCSMPLLQLRSAPLRGAEFEGTFEAPESLAPILDQVPYLVRSPGTPLLEVPGLREWVEHSVLGTDIRTLVVGGARTTATILQVGEALHAEFGGDGVKSAITGRTLPRLRVVVDATLCACERQLYEELCGDCFDQWRRGQLRYCSHDKDHLSVSPVDWALGQLRIAGVGVSTEGFQWGSDVFWEPAFLSVDRKAAKVRRREEERRAVEERERALAQAVLDKRNARLAAEERRRVGREERIRMGAAEAQQRELEREIARRAAVLKGFSAAVCEREVCATMERMLAILEGGSGGGLAPPASARTGGDSSSKAHSVVPPWVPRPSSATARLLRTPRALTPPPPLIPPGFVPGVRGWGDFEGTGDWYPCELAFVNPVTGLLDLAYDDGDFESDVPTERFELEKTTTAEKDMTEADTEEHAGEGNGQTEDHTLQHYEATELPQEMRTTLWGTEMTVGVESIDYDHDQGGENNDILRSGDDGEDAFFHNEDPEAGVEVVESFGVWDECIDAGSGHTYYRNTQSGQTTWDVPVTIKAAKYARGERC